MERDVFVTFQGVHRVMKAERVLRGAGIDVRLVPAPREISEDCGLSVSFYLCDRTAAESALARENSPCSAMHLWDGSAYQRLR